MALCILIGAAQASDQLLYFEAQGTSQYAKALRDAKFGRQFIGLTLRDLDHDDVISGNASGKVAGIENPAPEAATDCKAALRPRKRILFSWMSLYTLLSLHFLREVFGNDHEISSSF